jgi:hypothetical protein
LVYVSRTLYYSLDKKCPKVTPCGGQIRLANESAQCYSFQTSL